MPDTLPYLIIIAVLLVFLAWVLCKSASERERLYDRIQARDLPEYKAYLEKPKPPKVVDAPPPDYSQPMEMIEESTTAYADGQAAVSRLMGE
jgi:hypothetical protein